MSSKPFRKAQVTIFMVIAIVMIIGFAVLFSAMPEFFGPGEEHVEVTAYITSCLEMAAQDALIVLGQQGGFINLPENSHALQTAYLYDGQNKVPSNDEIADELAKFVNNNVQTCIDFTTLKGYTLKERYDPTTKIFISKKYVGFILNYEFFLQKGDEELHYNEFQATLPLKLGRLLEVVRKIVLDQVDNPGHVEISNYFDDNFDIIFTAVDNDLITSIKDLEYIVENKPYEFVFAQRYRQV